VDSDRSLEDLSVVPLLSGHATKFIFKFKQTSTQLITFIPGHTYETDIVFSVDGVLMYFTFEHQYNETILFSPDNDNLPVILNFIKFEQGKIIYPIAVEKLTVKW